MGTNLKSISFCLSTCSVANWHHLFTPKVFTKWILFVLHVQNEIREYFSIQADCEIHMELLSSCLTSAKYACCPQCICGLLSSSLYREWQLNCQALLGWERAGGKGNRRKTDNWWQETNVPWTRAGHLFHLSQCQYKGNTWTLAVSMANDLP